MTEKFNDNSEITANSKQIEILKKNFPNCFDKNGNFIASKMNEIVEESGTDFSKESYGLNWLGKSYARLLANENPLTLLKEDTEHNSKEENKDSENILIKGDNLEVLKHLRNAYSESVKMIYIDPPYNTGGDGFVYNDDRTFTIDELSKLAGVSLDEAKRILDFTQSNSNSHSAWLTFMYPRLYIARELLKEDGVIFISIDDNEVAQLKVLCDEVFGEENFMGNIVRTTGQTTGQDSGGLGSSFDYILLYTKNNTSSLSGLALTEKDLKRFENKDDKGYFAYDQMRKTGSNDKREDRPNMYYAIKDPDGNDLYPIAPVGYESCWRFEKKTYEKLLKEGFILWKKSKRKNGEIWWAYVKYYLEGRTKRPSPLWNDLDGNKKASRDLKNLFNGNKIFDFPKPIDMIKRCIQIVPNAKDEDIILDFFAGSGTTAHAVMDLNAKDNGNRKFITVQLPELIDEKKNKVAYDFVTNELKKEPTIFEITKERIIRASQKIKEETPNYNGDLGFKVYETMPLFDNFDSDIEELNDNVVLFNPNELQHEDLQTLLTTYKVHDGMRLNQALEEVVLDSYITYMGEDKLYFINNDFTTKDLKALIEKLDNDKAFKPSKLVLFGYNFTSKHQREIKEALQNYTNKKSIEIDMMVRY